MNNKVFGSVLIIAGSCIGAGMLAMPIISASVGFMTIALILILVWIAMFGSSILMLRVYAYNSPKDGFNSLTKKYLGAFSNRLAGFSLLFLIYALTAAYISGGGSIVSNIIESISGYHINPQLAIILFTLIFAGIVTVGTLWIDLSIKTLFSIKFLFLLLLIASFTPIIKIENVLNMPLEKGLLFTSIPIIFTSFGFHGSIPSIVSYLKGDQKKIRLAFFWGSTLPLVIYLLWQFAVLGSLEQNTFLLLLEQNLGLDGMIKSVSQMTQNPYIPMFFSIFAATALGTSFLGVSVGLLDYYVELLQTKTKSRIRLKAGMLTFLPAVIFALFYPNGFIVALGYAALAGVVLALIIPVLLFYKAMKVHKEKIKPLDYLLTFLISGLSICIIVAQFYK